jgi:nucleoside-diphosphate-sugar epimerase
MVRGIVSREMPELGPITLETVPSNDTRSYHVSSERIKRELGWTPQRTIEDAVIDLCRAFKAGRIANPLNDIRYYNVKTIQASGLA